MNRVPLLEFKIKNLLKARQRLKYHLIQPTWVQVTPRLNSQAFSSKLMSNPVKMVKDVKRLFSLVGSVILHCIQNITMPWGLFGIFTIVARMFYGNHVNQQRRAALWGGG